MNEQEEILTVSRITETKLKIKGSVFLCISEPAGSIDECNRQLDKIKKEYYKATHICYAYQIKKDIYRYSDSGEPSGTAGIRIYNAIQHYGLTNILVIVVRWFGGTKLGVGPLGKAYYSSALENLAVADKMKQYSYQMIIVTCSFHNLSSVHHIISKHEIKNINTFYGDEISISFYVKNSEINGLIDELKTICNITNDPTSCIYL